MVGVPEQITLSKLSRLNASKLREMTGYRVVVHKGKPVAVIYSYDEYQSLLRLVHALEDHLD